MRRFFALLIVVLGLPSGAGSQASSPLVVVELFTSQSCYSCPPAEAFLGELNRERRDVLALEYHVDYWDRLIYGGTAWKDVFSDAAFTARQERYARAILGRSSVYTPQMVIDGRREAVASRRGEVIGAIRAVQRERKSTAQITLARQSGEITVSLDGPPEPATAVWLIVFLREHTTAIKGGENKGRSLVNTNVVRDIRLVGEWIGGSATLRAPLTLEPGHDCAVIVQSRGQGPIVAAERCPATAA
jgi:hypothetical protein